MKEWVPLFSALVWPLFIIAIVLIFREDARRLGNHVLDAIGEGRGVKFGDLLEISAKASLADVEKREPGLSGEAIDLSVDSVGGYDEFVGQGSYALLDQIHRQVVSGQRRAIDVLMITNDRYYSSRLLRDYIATLGIRYIVYTDGGRFDGWTKSSLFAGQVPTHDKTLNYSQLRHDISGVLAETVGPGKSAGAVLQTMQEKALDALAVVDQSGEFRFIVEREAIVAKLVTNLLVLNEQHAKSAAND